MKKMKILIGKDNPILRKKADEIFVLELDKNLIKNLKQTLRQTKNGIGLAAPQIGQSKRAFVIKIEAVENPEVKKISLDDKFFVFINPKILGLSVKEIDFEEGCLSLPNLYGIVSRPESIKIEAFNEKGDRFALETNNYLARVIQHEIDHLNGILFIDKARETSKGVRSKTRL